MLHLGISSVKRRMSKCNSALQTGWTFYTLKFDQIRPKSATLRICFGFQNSQIVLAIPQLKSNSTHKYILIARTNIPNNTFIVVTSIQSRFKTDYLED